MDISITRKQKLFIDATSTEVLYGGAAGGGKSYGQVVDAFLCALRYAGIKQLILRRTYKELDKSIIRTALGLYPRGVYQYNSSSHTMTFRNGSIIDFGYLNSYNDVTQYQSAEYDIIRYDELTHFSEDMYDYMFSRVRGSNDFPKQIKCSSNPGSEGHAWVKKRFIEIGPPNVEHRVRLGMQDGAECEEDTRIYIPALVTDNKFLTQKDPNYIRRLRNLGESEYRALRYGDWDIFEGQYFDEFRRDLHISKPFTIPDHWRRYRAIDYGLDMLACLWAAFDELGNGYIYRELCEPNLVVSAAAQKIQALTVEPIACTYAPADLWGRTKDTGITIAELFLRGGVPLARVRNGRMDGWMNVKEWLKPVPNERPRLQIFDTCSEIIRCLPLLQHDKHNPSDVAGDPHDITHAPDALRYLLDGRPRPGEIPVEVDEDDKDFDAQVSDFMNYGG